MSWREQCSPVIYDTIRANEGKPEKEIRAALRAVYPFGARKYHPYKVWCDEVRKQLKKPKKTTKETTQIPLL
jgi:hypothetical protein